jgi:hypothetical protein
MNELQGKTTDTATLTNQKVSESENNQNSEELIGWQPYNLDHFAQELVLNYREQKDVLNETHKMRMTIAYGLERFWGEHLRLKRENQQKSNYWKAVWDKLAYILHKAGVTLPNDSVDHNNTQQIREMANKIWKMKPEDQRTALMVLTQFCDSLVWWTQRYKKKKDS